MSIKNKVIAFDLDDTLYKEIDFLKSAYMEIASIVDKSHPETLYNNMISNYYKGNNVFKFISETYAAYTVERLLKIYREHYPSISLSNEEWNVLLKLKTEAITGLITDGRSLTQRNKIKALGLENYFDKIVISEEIGYSKPDIRLFNEFKKYGISQFRVRAEWVTAGDGNVCSRCADMEGRVFSLDEIRELIPYHPFCRCLALPIV